MKLLSRVKDGAIRSDGEIYKYNPQQLKGFADSLSCRLDLDYWVYHDKLSRDDITLLYLDVVELVLKRSGFGSYKAALLLDHIAAVYATNELLNNASSNGFMGKNIQHWKHHQETTFHS